MALYSENNDWQRFARQKLQNSAQNLQQKQAGLEAAQNQKQKTTLESALSGLVGGLKERGSDILNTAKNIGKTVVGGINQIGANKAIENAQKDDSARRNEIAKKYGFNSYSEAINSGKVGDDFWNEIKSNNEKTKEKIEQNNARQGSFGDVTKINTNEAKGQALNTIDSVLGLLPGGAGAAANVLGGGLSGVGDEYKAAARENRDIDWTNARNNALVGAASGAAGMAGGSALGNAASKLGGNALGKLAGSQLAKGIAGGAAAGAVGGGLGTALNGGSLEDALLAAKEGAKAGGIGGGVMAGAMGLGGTALDKIRNRGGNIPTPDVEPMEAMTVQKNRIEQPTAQRIEAEAPSARRGIAITDLDAGEQAINVRNGRPTESRGKYIDSVVRRSDANLPEAQRLSVGDRFRNNFDDTLDNLISRGDMGEGADIIDTLRASGVREPELAAIKSGARDYAADNNPFSAYGINSRQDLPMLDRQEYYNDTIGKLKNRGGSMSGADVPSYMQDRLRNGQATTGGSTIDNDTILSELFGNNLDKTEKYRLYEELAATPQGATYTPENIAYALALDPQLSNRVQGQMLDLASPARKISIENALGQTQDVPVENLTTNYQRSTIPARQYEQAAVKMPEAEIATRTTEAPMALEAETPMVQTTNGGAKRALSNTLKNTGNELQTAGTNITRAERKRLGIDNAGEVVNNTRKRTGIGDIYDQAEFAKTITGSGDQSIMDTIQRTQMAKDRQMLTTEDYKAALGDIIDKGWSKSTMGSEKAKKQFINNLVDDLGRKDPIDAANWLKDQAAAERAVSKGNSEGAPKAKEKAKLYTELANKMDEVTYSAIPEKNIKAMFNDTITEFRARANEAGAAGNKKWQKAYNMLADELENTEPTIKNYRSFKKDFVKSSQVANISAGARSGSLDAGIGRGFNIKNRIVNTALGPVVDKGLAFVGGKLSDLGEKIENGKSNANAGAVRNAIGGVASKAGEKLGNATSKLNNESLANLSLGGYETLGNMAQNAANRQIGYGQARDAVERQNNAQAISQAQSDYDNALADYQNEEQQVNNAIAQAQAMQSPLGRIEQAMTLALNAGDITAYGQLADLYKQAYNIYEMQNPTSTSNAKALNATQSRALSASHMLDELEQMNPTTKSVLANTKLGGGLVKLTGGDEYTTQATALARELGYLQSGATIKDDELQAIYDSFIPNKFDSEANRQRKLQNARKLIEDNLADTSTLAA